MGWAAEKKLAKGEGLGRSPEQEQSLDVLKVDRAQFSGK